MLIAQLIALLMSGPTGFLVALFHDPFTSLEFTCMFVDVLLFGCCGFLLASLNMY